MRKTIDNLLHLTVLMAWLPVCLLFSCSGSEQTSVFHLSGTFWQDSISNAETAMLIVDNHRDAVRHNIPVNKGTFSFSDEISDIAELTLAYQGSSWHLYAAPGDNIVIKTDSLGNYSLQNTDSINTWITEKDSILLNKQAKVRRNYIDSLCRKDRNDLRSALLILEQMAEVQDSLFVRRCLGTLSPEAKPEWIIRAIDDQFDVISLGNKLQTRLPREVLKLSNDTTYALLDSRQESLLIFLWADYDSASIDSLKLLVDIAKNYGLYEYAKDFKSAKITGKPKFLSKLLKTAPSNDIIANKLQKKRHIELMTVCIHNTDSATWLKTIKDIPGKHTWIEGGFSHPLLTSFNINTLPSNIEADRFSNKQGIDRWGKDLTNWLEGTPTKSE